MTIPCDHHAEAAYIAAAMLDANVLLEHPVRADDMSARQHRLCFDAMDAIARRRHQLSTEALRSELERLGVPPEAALDYSLSATSGPVALPGPVSRRLREVGEMRRRYEQATRIQAACSAHSLDEARGLCAALAQLDTHGDVNAIGFKQVVDGTIEAYVQLGTDKDRSVALGTPAIDAHWRPYPGSLTVVGAATGTGKSTLLTSWALSLARRGIANGIVSAEDPVEDFGSKMLGELSQVDPASIWKGNADKHEMARVIAAAEKHEALPFAFSYVGSRRLDDVLAAMRIQARKHGARVIAVDYLQTITPRMNSGRDVREKTDAVLAELIVEASALGVALVLASQLRRPDREAPEPSVTALKESGTIENRAQAIVLLWRDDAKANGVVFAKLAKVKRGPSGKRFRLERDPDTGGLMQASNDGDPGPSDDDFGGEPYQVGGWR